MIKVNYIGKECVHVFLDSVGNEVLEIRPLADYYHIHDAPPGSPRNIPVKEGHTWSLSFVKYKYDTIDGELHDGEYAFVVENGVDKALFIEGSKFTNLPKNQFLLEKSLVI